MDLRARKFTSAAAAAAVAAALAGAPAQAKSEPADPATFSYLATIDCGSGLVKVGSGDDVWAPLVRLSNSRKYFPVAWNLRAKGRSIKLRKPGKRNQPTMKCSYVDDVAHGTVTLLRHRRK
jgi:uncharacterized membrane protein